MQGSRLLSNGALLGLLFLAMGFTYGWPSATRRFLVLSYFLAVICFVGSAAFAGSLRELATDRSLRVQGVLADVLGFALYLSGGARPLHFVSLMAVGCGAVVGGILRFSISNVSRRLARSARRVRGRLLKRIGFGRRRAKARSR